MNQHPPSSRPLIVLSLEGLARASLGCYGCSWNRTPAVDAIAGGGLVWDRFLAESDCPAAVLQTWLESDWTNAWRSAGSLELVTDTEHAGSPSFDRITRLSGSSPPKQPARDIVETQLGQLISAAIDRDQQSGDWSVMWIHSDTLTRCWDAPRDLYPLDQIDGEHEPESAFSEGGDDDTHESRQPSLPRLFDSTVPPSFQRQPNDHPDLVSSWMRTYACQVRLVDVLIEILLQALDVQDPWFVLAGTSGFRLGQGGWVGSRGESIRSADIHLPLLVSDLGPLRIPRLVPSGALPDWLRQLAGDEHPMPSPSLLDLSLDRDVKFETVSARAIQAVTTAEWFYVQDRDQTEHLFLKPDDVEDFNDVARVEEEVVAAFRQRTGE